MRYIKLCFVFLPLFALAQQSPVEQVRKHVQAQTRVIMQSYQEFLSIPNIASDMPNIERNAAWIAHQMRALQLDKVQLLYPTTKGVPPAVYGEIMTPGATKTLIFYAHYDGQPVDSTKWAPGLHPFKPSLYTDALQNGGKLIAYDQASYEPQWRIYGRGASDDKAGVMAILQAYAALKANGIAPKVNIKFFFEGEEEAGSDHLHEILQANQALLQGDLWVICDGPVHQSGQQQIVFGVRGDTHLEVTVFGPTRPLHSGHYGNWAPNPGMLLAKLLASMKDESGKVLVKGFYDDVTPLSAAEKAALAKVPPVETALQKELGIAQVENPKLSLAEAINQPSLNINGITVAGTGKYSANVIPVKAVASIDLRLVMGNDWKKQQDKMIQHIQSQGYFVTSKEPTDEERIRYPKIAMVVRSGGYNAQKTSMQHPLALKVVEAVATAQGKVVLTPTLGGSLPLFVFEQYLKTPPITVPIANHDNNQHAENENIRLKNLFDGIVTFASIMLLPK